MRKTTSAFIIVALALFSAVAGAQRPRPQDVDLQAAIRSETVDGDLNRAIQQYKDIASKYASDRAVVARALLRLGECYQKFGDAQAQATFSRILREYADQREVAAEAQARVKVAGAPLASAGTLRRGLSRVCADENCRYFSVSPDGRYLLGDWGMRDLVTGDTRQYLAGTDQEGFTVSPDGKQVAWAVGPLGPDDSDVHEMRVATFDGLKDVPGRRVFHNPEIQYNESFGWSPDGREIYAVLWRNPDDSELIAAISVADGSFRQIKSLDWHHPEKVSLSPDGRYIVYDVPVSRESPDDRDVFVLAADGSTETPLVRDRWRDTAPVWTPDGQAVVFRSDRDGMLGLWRVQVKEGKPQGSPTLVQRLDSNVWPIGFSRDGTFYYQKYTTPDTNVLAAEIDLDAGTVTRTPARFVDTFPGRNSAPSYSPDGKSMAYLSQRTMAGIGSDFLSLVIRSLESGSERVIRGAFTNRVAPVWSPDGQSVLVSASNGGFTRRPFLQRIDLKTGQDLLRDALLVDTAALSPDGRRLYYYFRNERPNDTSLIAYDLETRRQTILVERFSRADNRPRIAVSPDGRQIAFVSRTSTAATQSADVRLMPADGGAPRTLPSLGAQKLNVIRWSADGTSVLVQAGNGRLWWVPADGGPARRIGEGTLPAIEDIHPDGKQIAATERLTQPTSEVWVDPDLLRVDSRDSSSAASTAGAAIRSVSGIYVASFDAGAGTVRGQATRVDGNSPEAACAPSWMPDGKSLVFKRQSPPGTGGQFTLRWVVRTIDAGQEEPWPNMGGGPCWSSLVWLQDSKRFLNASYIDGPVFRADLAAVPSFGARPSPAQVTNVQLSGTQTAVAPSVDGETLYVTVHDEKEHRTSIASVDVASGARRTLWVAPFPADTLGLVPLRLAISPDGRTLALILTSAGKSHLVRVGVDGSGYRDLYSAEGPGPDGAALSRSGLEWTSDGRSLLFMQADRNGQRLMRIAADGGRPEFTGLSIGDSAAHLPAMFDLSPDNRRIVFYSPGPPTIATGTAR